MLWELSTPFVFMRWLLHALGRHESRLYIANGVAMIVVFFLCRNLLGAGAARAPRRAPRPRAAPALRGSLPAARSAAGPAPAGRQGPRTPARDPGRGAQRCR